MYKRLSNFRPLEIKSEVEKVVTLLCLMVSNTCSPLRHCVALGHRSYFGRTAGHHMYRSVSSEL